MPVNEYDHVYGLDPALYNGRIYTYAAPRNTTGDPFLSGADYCKGHITIEGKIYDGLNLNYDIFNQQILLKYDNIIVQLILLKYQNHGLKKLVLKA